MTTLPGQLPATDPPRGVSLGDLITRGVLDATVLAGHGGLDRRVRLLNVMEVPDILDYVKPHELLVTTAYPLRERADDIVELIESLDDAGLAGLGVKLGRYMEALPPAALEVADARGFPLVQLPDTTRFDEVLNDVLTHVLDDQSTRLARSERIHRTFLQLVVDGGGVEAIAQELSALVTAPTAIVALDGTVLAACRMEEVVGGDSPARLDLSSETGHLRMGADHRKVTVAAAAAGPRLFGHVVAVTSPAVDGDETGRAADERMALESAATVTALALSMASEIQAVESKYESDLMHDLLTGRAGATGDVLRRARSFGWDLDRPLITLVLQFDERRDAEGDDAGTDPMRRRTPLAVLLTPKLRDRDPRAAVVRFSEEVVVLTAPFTGPTGRTDATQYLSRVVDAASESTGLVVSGGLSRPVDQVSDITRGYEQAVNALAIGRKVNGPGHVSHFDELGAHRLLSLIDDVEELRSFASEVLGELGGPDETTEDLRNTLQVLLATNLNVAESARRLHFHYNTLRYRIDKLEGMVGPFMVNADVRLNVHLALLIHGMRGL